MKYFLICIVSLFLSSSLMASNVELFQYDKIELENKISKINQLEDYVNSHQGITLKELQSEQNDFAVGVVNDDDPFNENPENDLTFIHGYFIGIGGCLILFAVYYAISNVLS